MAGDEGI